MVTISGVIIQIISIIIILLHDSSLSKELPSWIYIYFIISIFIAQTTDAIDGKHARNTKRSSPLGQLIDHGCDALSNSFIVIMAAQTFKYSGSFYTQATQLIVQMNFFLFNWDEHLNGIMLTNVDNFGKTEYEFIAMAMIASPLLLGYPLIDRKILFGLSIPQMIVFINVILYN